MPERNNPHNIEAEQSVLGSMFLTKKALQKSLEGLARDDFYLDSHQKIFEAIKEFNDTLSNSGDNVTQEIFNFSNSWIV